jgi:hypothetical protein
VLSVTPAALKTSFYATGISLITATDVETIPKKEKHAVCSKPKNSFSINPTIIIERLKGGWRIVS